MDSGIRRQVLRDLIAAPAGAVAPARAAAEGLEQEPAMPYDDDITSTARPVQ